MTQQKILIASDHAGYKLKEQLKTILNHVAWTDLGTQSENSVDYPDYAAMLCKEIQAGGSNLGVLICGTGIGMSIAANKFDGIRAAVVENPWTAHLTKEHNHCNVLCIGSRITAPEYAAQIIQSWLETPYSQDPKHKNRVAKLR
jgi:ribose 5-phosphate isomerase B